MLQRFYNYLKVMLIVEKLKIAAQVINTIGRHEMG